MMLCSARKMFPDIVKFTWEGLTSEDEILEHRDETSEVQITSMVIIQNKKIKNGEFSCSVQHADKDKVKKLTIPKGKEDFLNNLITFDYIYILSASGVFNSNKTRLINLYIVLLA